MMHTSTIIFLIGKLLKEKRKRWFELLTSYPSSLRNSLMSGGSVPKNLVSFFTLEGLERAGSSESLINGWDCDLTIAILVWVLSAAISPLMFSISCEYLIVVSFGYSNSFFRLFLLSFLFLTLFCCWIWFEDNLISIRKSKKIGRV